MQSVPITTKVVSSNLVYGEVYSIQHYVIKLVNDLVRSVVFYWYSLFNVKTKIRNDYDIIFFILRL